MKTADTNPAPAWDAGLLVNPHAVADKRERVRKMFAAIAPSYDLNNRLHSLGMDQRWRKRAVKLAELTPADRVVDVACGTGDLTLSFAKAFMRLGSSVIGIDFTYGMLAIALTKTKRLKNENGKMQNANCVFLNGDALMLPVSDMSADVVSIAFGIRNVADPAAALREFYR